MTLYIVTVKFKPNKLHDPMHKKVSGCAFSDMCTDSTGAHHSILVESESMDKLYETMMDYHITRVEEVDVSK